MLLFRGYIAAGVFFFGLFLLLVGDPGDLGCIAVAYEMVNLFALVAHLGAEPGFVSIVKDIFLVAEYFIVALVLYFKLAYRVFIFH